MPSTVTKPQAASRTYVIPTRKPKRRLVAPSTVDLVETCAPASGKRVQCAECSKAQNGGQVVDNAYPWLSNVRQVVPELETNIQHALARANAAEVRLVMRALHCDHCDFVQVWGEVAKANGQPAGIVLTAPVIIRDRKHVEAFLKQYPQAAGVTQR